MLLSTSYRGKVYLGESHEMIGLVEEIVDIDRRLSLSFQGKLVLIREGGAYKLIKSASLLVP